MTISRNRIKELRSLAHRKHRLQAGVFLVEGIRLVTEALASPLLKEIFMTHEFSDSPDGAALGPKIPQSVIQSLVSNVQAEQISDTRQPQGLFALLSLPPNEIPSPGEILGPMLILADLSDPGNLGTILRTAGWFNIQTVLISAESADIFNPKVLRSAMGAHFHIPYLHQGDIHKTILGLKEIGVEILGAVMDGTSMHDVHLKDARWALMMGNEAHGLSEYWRAQTDRSVSIPPRGSVESLNVTVATGILLQNFLG